MTKRLMLILLALILLPLTASLQTLKAQKVVLHMTGNQKAEYDISQLDSINIVNAGSSGDNPSTDPSVTGDAIDITNKSATLVGYATSIRESLANDLRVGFIYCLEGTPNKNNGTQVTVSKNDVAEDGRYTATIENLLSDATYYFRSFVYQSGLWFYGKVKSFVTAGIDINFTTGDATDITCFSAKVSGSVDVQSTYSSLTYGICYGTTIEPTTNDNIQTAASNDFTFQLRQLTGGTTYYYRPYAIFDGQTYYGVVHTFRTHDDNVVETGNIDEETLTVTSHLTIGGGAYSSLVLGVCYGKTETPTINDYTLTSDEVDDENNYTIQLFNPDYGTIYYRAYVLIDGIPHYGVVKSFFLSPRTEAERTVIIYMAGDNSLGDATNYNAIPLDTVEMVRGKDMIPEDVNFVIFTDDKQHKPAIYELSRESGIRLWKQYEEELCTTDSEVMLDVLRTIENYFPARHYGITFWSYASGWAPERKSSRQKTFGKDETGSTSGKYEMEIPVLHDVLAQLPKFDYIFFDACFMQSIEVAYELRDVTNYMIGSPAEIPGPGAPYDIIIEALCKSDVEGIIRGYDSAYPVGPYTGVLLSCIDCTKLDALAEITGQLLTPYYMGRTQASTTDFQSYCYDMTYYTHLKKYTFCFDMRTTMRKLLKEEGEGNEEKYATWMETFDQAVPLRTLSDSHRWFAQYCSKSIVLDPTCYGGVSMFVPMNAYNGFGWNEDFQKTSWYEATGWAATGW